MTLYSGTKLAAHFSWARANAKFQQTRFPERVFLFVSGESSMPRKKASGTKATGTNATTKPKKADFKGFINYAPTNDDKKQFEQLLDSGHDPLQQRDDVLEEGYKISCTWQPSQECYQSTLYCTDSTLPNGGLLLSARAADSRTAEQRVLFLHIHVLGNDWAASVDSIPSDEW